SLHGAMGTLPTTNFAEPIGLAATFDDELVRRVGRVIATEVRGLHALARQTGRTGRIGTGLNTWSPNINIFRDPRWGRGQETYGEDPFLAARMGVAYVKGVQGEDPRWYDIIATPKHYAVHSGPESTRHSANVYVSRHDLEDTYLPAFRAAIVEGGAGSVMCAYNRVGAALGIERRRRAGDAHATDRHVAHEQRQAAFGGGDHRRLWQVPVGGLAGRDAIDRGRTSLPLRKRSAGRAMRIGKAGQVAAVVEHRHRDLVAGLARVVQAVVDDGIGGAWFQHRTRLLRGGGQGGHGEGQDDARGQCFHADAPGSG